MQAQENYMSFIQKLLKKLQDKKLINTGDLNIIVVQRVGNISYNAKTDIVRGEWTGNPTICVAKYMPKISNLDSKKYAVLTANNHIFEHKPLLHCLEGEWIVKSVNPFILKTGEVLQPRITLKEIAEIEKQLNKSIENKKESIKWALSTIL